MDHAVPTEKRSGSACMIAAQASAAVQSPTSPRPGGTGITMTGKQSGHLRRSSLIRTIASSIVRPRRGRGGVAMPRERSASLVASTMRTSAVPSNEVLRLRPSCLSAKSILCRASAR